MSNASDFIIENGVLKKYVGPGGDVVIPDSVIAIGDEAFCECSNLTGITIPDSVTSIGAVAFGRCTSLKNVIVPDSVTSIGAFAFKECKSLTSINIPARVTSIGNEAFCKCSNLTNITIPDSVSSIGGNVFSGCKRLVSIIIGNGVSKIGWGAFNDCTGLTAITIPDSVTTIEGNAFYGCKCLASIIIGNGATSIGDYAFQDCAGLTDITIPDCVTSIGREVFNGCKSLGKVIIGNGVTSISDYAFCECTGLTGIVIGNSVTHIGDCAFGGCTGLTDITIPDCVTNIGRYAFSRCKSLAKVTIGNGVASIGDYAFCDCTGLTNIVIPNSVTSIGIKAFAGCKKLKGIVIADSVASIGKQAFNDCAPDLSIDISNPAMLAPEYRYAAVVCFAEENADTDDPRCAAFYKLIKSNAEKWMKQAINNPALIMLMCREKLIAAKLAPEYLKAAQATGDTECIARLVEYNANTLTAGEKKRVATQKEKSEDTVIERKIARQKKASIKGLIFVFVGNPETFKSQSEWKAFVTKKGGKVVAAVSSKVDYLILADPSSNSEQKKKAEKLNIDIITEGQFNDLAGRSFDINKKNVLVKYWGGGGNVVIPEGVTSIGLRAFEQCKSVQSVIIPEGVTNIGKNAFWGCRELSSVSIPDSVTKIAAGAFDYCDKLRYYIYDSAKYLGNETNPFMVLIEATSRQIESCDVHNDTRLIYEGAFYGCSKLTSLTLPNSVIGIAEDPAVLNKEDLVILCGEKGFSLLPKEVKNRLAALWEKDPDIFGEEQVKAILKYLKRTVKTETKEKAPRAKKVPTTDWKQNYRWIIGEDGAIITKYKGTEANVTIPSEIEGNAVVWIDKNAFKGNEHICSVKIPSTVTTIAENAFAYCKKLKTVEWGEGLRTIEKRAFYGSFCEEKVIYLPEGLETIGVNAFANPNETETYPLSFKEEIHLPASIKVFKNFLGELRDYDCNDAHVYFNGTETKIENKDFPYEMVVLHVPKGSKTEKYAKKTNLPVIAE